MRRLRAVALVACVAGTAVACNKGPARAALAESDQALAAARPELARYAPEELGRITADAESARGLLAAGRYTDSLRLAQKLPERIVLASTMASTRKGELTPAWSGLAGSLPPSIAALRARMDELDASRWPRGFDPAAIEAARAELRRVEASWGEAESAFRSGDVLEAVRIGSDARTNATALAARIQKSSAPAPPSPRAESTPRASPTPSAPGSELAPPAELPAPAPTGDSPPPPDTPPATTVPPVPDQP